MPNCMRAGERDDRNNLPWISCLLTAPNSIRLSGYGNGRVGTAFTIPISRSWRWWWRRWSNSSRNGQSRMSSVQTSVESNPQYIISLCINTVRIEERHQRVYETVKLYANAILGATRA